MKNNRATEAGSNEKSANRQTTHVIKMIVVNVAIFLLLWLCYSFISWVVVPLLAYELLLIYLLTSNTGGRNIQHKKMLGPWCLIVPIGMGCISILRYSFYQGSETLWVGRSELIVWMISVIIGILVMLLINKNSRIKTGVALGLLIIAVVTLSAVGQIKMINDLPIANKSMNVNYYVEKKSN